MTGKEQPGTRPTGVQIAEFTFDQLGVGQSASFSQKISAEAVSAFAKLTGDLNPLHMDESFAAQSRFGKRVSHGLLVHSYLSTLAGVYLPGVYSLIFSVESKFKKPVFIGDVVTIAGTIAKKQEVGKLVTISAQITNQRGELCIDSVLIVSVQK